jgi:UDP:flavonoid glycosyltransferase YjiC (YdhE family)
MRVLLSTIGSRGEVQPVVALAERLRRAGQEVRICAPPDFGDWIEAIGIPFTPVGPELRWTAKTPVATPEQRRQAIEGTVATQFATIPTAAQGCDVIVACGALQIAAHSIAEQLGIRYIYAAYCPITLPSAHHAPPALPGRTPNPTADNPTLWAQDAQHWNEIWAPTLNSQRSTTGLPPIDDVRTHIFTTQPWLAADPTVAPWPANPTATPQPTDPTATPQPAAYTIARQPTNPKTAARPADPAVAGEPTEPTVAPQPADPTVASQPGGPVTPQPMDSTVAARPADPTITPQPANPTAALRLADPTIARRPADRDVVQTGAWILPDDRPLSAELETFLAAGEPPIYFGFGSIRAPQDLSKIMIEAARALGRRAIVLRGWADLALPDDTPDCLSIGEVNQQALFRRVAAAVHHGGAGTTTAAAGAGVPQVVIPQHYDQPYFARRVHDLGIGSAHAPGAPTADSLAAALHQALQSEVANRAKIVSDAVRADGADVATRRLLATD